MLIVRFTVSLAAIRQLRLRPLELTGAAPTQPLSPPTVEARGAAVDRTPPRGTCRP